MNSSAQQKALLTPFMPPYCSFYYKLHKTTTSNCLKRKYGPFSPTKIDFHEDISTTKQTLGGNDYVMKSFIVLRL